jgi:hypothetical protein
MDEMLNKLFTLDEKTSEAYYECFMERKDRKIEEMKDRLEKEAGIPKEEIDYSKESLVSIWTYVRKRIRKNRPWEVIKKSDLPCWYWMENSALNNIRTKNFSNESIFWIDTLSYYLGECFIKNLGGCWTRSKGVNHPFEYHDYKPLISFTNPESIDQEPVTTLYILSDRIIENREIFRERDLVNIIESHLEFSKRDL